MHCSILNVRFQLLVVLIMGDNSDDEVLEISRDQFVHKVDEALRKDYGFFFSHEEPNVHQDLCIQQEDAITIKEGVGKTRVNNMTLIVLPREL
ncbi:hypothetical protein Hanom_Chr03g00226211 [Helianthus anomalus]